ncbi:nuclear transport factor 2 family protein [Caulobacter sp. NIBR1757]|uniref:nuclear transport factor 2 family protein n=1 Tax=Caulobacter sp. NIBR1757 TaxID=3016000 RepID=UPI0022F08567|nr:nuclear transport factor 2 family protein [Caulobacter sp. NIBR1757]
MSEGAPAPRDVVAAYIEAHNRQDIAAVARLIAANARFGISDEIDSGEVVVGRYRDIVYKNFPKAHTEPLDQLTYGDMVAQTERVTGIGPDGEIGMTVYRVVRGCIIDLTISHSPDGED